MVPDEHLEFVEAVWTRRPVFTYVFFGLNILVFLLMALAGGADEPVLLAFGVKDNASIARGEWWRFITPIFIHIGVLHLVLNSYAIWIVAPQVEKLYGPARFVILYVLTGIAAVYGSYLYHPQTISAGASGAIFGLFGILLVFGIRYRNSIPPFFKRAVGTGVLPVIVINLLIGFSIGSIVDNAAHIGGLLAGVALGALVPFQRPGAETPGIFKVLQMLLLSTIVVSFYAVERNYNGPHFSARNLPRSLTQILPTGGGSGINDFVNAINTAQNTFESSARDLEAGRINRLGMMKAAASKSIDQLRRVPSFDAKADELTTTLLRVMQDQYELIQDVERSGSVTLAHSRRLKENVHKYDDLMTDFSKWVESEGSRYRIEKARER